MTKNFLSPITNTKLTTWSYKVVREMAGVNALLKFLTNLLILAVPLPLGKYRALHPGPFIYLLPNLITHLLT